MAAHHRVGCDDPQVLAPAHTPVASQHPEELVPEAQASTRSCSGRAGQDGELVAQQQVLDHEIPARATRAVSLGTGPIGSGRSDMVLPHPRGAFTGTGVPGTVASINNAELAITTDRPQDRATLVVSCDVNFTEVEVNAMDILGLRYTLQPGGTSTPYSRRTCRWTTCTSA